MIYKNLEKRKLGENPYSYIQLVSKINFRSDVVKFGNCIYKDKAANRN